MGSNLFRISLVALMVANVGCGAKVISSADVLAASEDGPVGNALVDGTWKDISDGSYCQDKSADNIDLGGYTVGSIKQNVIIDGTNFKAEVKAYTSTDCTGSFKYVTEDMQTSDSLVYFNDFPIEYVASVETSDQDTIFFFFFKWNGDNNGAVLKLVAGSPNMLYGKMISTYSDGDDWATILSNNAGLSTFLSDPANNFDLSLEAID